MVRAFFISPGGEIIPATINHIQKVSETPELFNLTKEEIESIFKKFDEPIGLEGKARNQILAGLIEADHKKGNEWE